LKLNGTHIISYYLILSHFILSNKKAEWTNIMITR